MSEPLPIDNDNQTLHLTEQEAAKELAEALARKNWVLATEIQGGDISKGQIPDGLGYRVAPPDGNVRDRR